MFSCMKQVFRILFRKNTEDFSRFSLEFQAIFVEIPRIDHSVSRDFFLLDSGGWNPWKGRGGDKNLAKFH